MEQSPFKSHNTSIERLSSSFDFVSSSDDDVVTKERMTRHLHKYDKENSVKNTYNSTELLVLDKRLKDERNSGQISHQKGVRIDCEYKGVNEADAVEENTRKKSIQSESIEESANCCHEKHVISPSCRYSEHIKKPVPLPRNRAKKEVLPSSETREEVVDESHQQIVSGSGSLNLVHSVEQLQYSNIAADGDSGDSDCILPQKVERKKERKKKDVPSHFEKQEEIELRNIKTASDVKIDRVVSSSRKTSSHKSRRKDREVAVETALMTEESQLAQLNYDKIIGIFIHRSECLQVHPLIRHPLVKVHLLDASTGSYLKKSHAGRSVSFYYENQDVDYILPLMTEMFDYKERR